MWPRRTKRAESESSVVKAIASSQPLVTAHASVTRDGGGSFSFAGEVPAEVRSQLLLASLPVAGGVVSPMTRGDTEPQEQKPKLQSRNSIIRQEDGTFAFQGKVPDEVRTRLQEMEQEKGGPTNVKHNFGIRALAGGGFDLSDALPSEVAMLPILQDGCPSPRLSGVVGRSALHCSRCKREAQPSR